MKRTILHKITLITVLALALAGCNTVKGLGEDIQKGGQAIERAAS